MHIKLKFVWWQAQADVQCRPLQGDGTPWCYSLQLGSAKNLPVHPVFHVSLLNEYRSDGSCQPPLSPDLFELDGEAHWNMEKHMSHEWQWTGPWPKLYSLIHWEGFSHENDTSEPAENLCHASRPVKTYCARLLAAGGSLDPSVRVAKSVRLPPLLHCRCHRLLLTR